MSGHSKWATTKAKKAKTDAARGKVFTKIGRELIVAVKQGGPDPNNNSKLRDVIAKAKAANMPNDNIMRSIKKAAGSADADNYESITYEGYGPCGVAFIVDTLTDNRNRTASDVRHLFDKFGNGMGNSGCVSWMFDKKGVIVIERGLETDEDELMMTALDAGAEDFVPQEDVFEVYTAPEDFSAVREALETAGYSFVSAEIDMVPQNTVAVTDEESIAKVNRLIDNLEDNDDVQNVYHNADMPEEEEED